MFRNVASGICQCVCIIQRNSKLCKKNYGSLSGSCPIVHNNVEIECNWVKIGSNCCNHPTIDATVLVLRIREPFQIWVFFAYYYFPLQSKTGWLRGLHKIRRNFSDDEISVHFLRIKKWNPFIDLRLKMSRNWALISVEEGSIHKLSKASTNSRVNFVMHIILKLWEAFHPKIARWIQHVLSH